MQENKFVKREKMPRYIDIGVALNELEHTPFYDNRDFETTKVMLKTMPTANVMEVKHGEWLWMGDKGDSRWMCSVCKGKENVPTIMGKPIVWDYCPNCGAIMGVNDDYR